MYFLRPSELRNKSEIFDFYLNFEKLTIRSIRINLNFGNKLHILKIKFKILKVKFAIFDLLRFGKSVLTQIFQVLPQFSTI